MGCVLKKWVGDPSVTGVAAAFKNVFLARNRTPGAGQDAAEAASTSGNKRKY